LGNEFRRNKGTTPIFLRDNHNKSKDGRNDTTRDRIKNNRNRITDSLKPEWLLDPKAELSPRIILVTC